MATNNPVGSALINELSNIVKNQSTSESNDNFSSSTTSMTSKLGIPSPRKAINSSNTRLIRSFTLFDNRDFLPRPFQIELYEACKSRDTIVFLRPGQGKYFISVMLVKYFNQYKFPTPLSSSSSYHHNSRGEDHYFQKIFFLTKSLNSIKLYSSVFNAHSDLRIGEYLDPDQAKQWSREQWRQQLISFDMHLMFAELFEYLLEQNLVHAGHVNLLILDDVHKILLCPDGTESDCYTRIVRKLRTSELNGNEITKKYRILGLSSSILLEDVPSKVFEKMIEQIESNLGCSCETYADLRMINKYSIQSRIKLRCYPPLIANEAAAARNNGRDYRYQLALFMIRNYSGQFFQFITNISAKTVGGITTDSVINNETIARIVVDVLEVFGTLGEWCTLKLIEMVNRELYDTIILMSKTQSNYLYLLNTAHSALRLIRQSILSYLEPEIVSTIDQSERRLTLEQFLSISSPKLHLLAHILCDYLGELCQPPTGQTSHSSFAFPANICSLLYAENRSVVRVLDEWLTELAAIARDSSIINCLSFIQPDHVFLADDDGKNEMKNFYYRKHQKSLHEIYYYRQQEETLRRFRLAHQCNLLVTTSMSAEGLDVNRCNLVICFDPPRTFQQFIQSKGRVRVERGQFVVLVEQTNHRNYLQKFQEFCNIEKIFTKLVPLNNQVIIEQEPQIQKLTPSDLKLETKVQQKQQSQPSKPLEPTLATNKQSKAEPDHLNQKLVQKKTDKCSTTVGSGGGQISTNLSTVQLTLNNAISILNRYCNKLPSDTFTKLVPNYKIEAVVDDCDSDASSDTTASGFTHKYRCRLYLPINSTYRDEIVGESKPTQSLAKQSAAFQTVKTLREIGELDQNYYPVGKETTRYIEKLGLQDCFINTKNPSSHNQQHSFSTQASSLIQQQHSKGNRYHRIQHRNIASKHRQYYNKKVADSLCGQVFKYDSEQNRHYIQYLYQFDMKLTYRLSEEQNIRGRRIIDPAETTRTFGIIVPKYLPPLCDFTIYNRSGEVTVSLVPILVSNSGYGLEVSEEQISRIENFHQYTFENVLPLGKSSIRFDRENGSNGNYLIVPINYQDDQDNDNSQKNGINKSIDWKFIDLICRHRQDPKSYDETIFRYDDQKRFIFEESLYQDAVVIPKYRKDKLQSFYYVAEICKDLTPLSPFPDHDYESFKEYYRLKYGKVITNLSQPLLDVDHTSARLNLLTPRFLNRKGFPLTLSTMKSNHGVGCHQSKRNPQQKQILVPELCFIHPFPASFWRKAVGLPCILYRLNLLLIAEELRFKIAKEAQIGRTDLPEGEKWPKLDFGWSSLVERARQLQKQQNEDSEPQHTKIPTTTKNCLNPSKSSIPDFVIDTFDPSIVPLSQGSQDSCFQNKNDPFSFIDDWSSFSIALPESELIQNDEFMPQIKIISGPFESDSSDSFVSRVKMFSEDYEISNNSLQDSEKEYKSELTIVEVDDDGKPIAQNKEKFTNRSTEKSLMKPVVRAGSPTYWKDQKMMSQTKIPDDFIWTKWDEEDEKEMEMDSKKISIETKFSLNMEELSKEISNFMKFPPKTDYEEDYEDFNLGDDTDFENEEDATASKLSKYSKTKSQKRRIKPVITSLSDLDDDDDDDRASYSDFDLYDSSDDDDDDDDDNFDDEEEEDEENSSDFDDDDFFHENFGDDYGCPNRNGKRGSRNGQNYQNIRTLSQTMNAYQMKSVIYDVLKIELLYDPKQIEQRSLKTYYHQRFGLADQDLHSEHFRKRKLFDEMYREEKQQVMECVQKICEQMKLDGNEVESSKSKDELTFSHLEPERIEYDNSIDDISFDNPLLEILMKKIDPDLLASLKIFPDIDDEIQQKPERDILQENVNNETLTDIYMKKTEVKFGELLPNRNPDLVSSADADLLQHQEKTELPNLQHQTTLHTLPKWLYQTTEQNNSNFKLGPHPSLILQAITMSNSSDGINLERLETVGDSFLKYSITAFLFCMCPELNEGKLSFLRSRQISNINLHRLGQRISLGQLMIASKFEPVDNWCPPSYQVLENPEQMDSKNKTAINKVPYNLLTQHSIPNKSIADCVEALIGTYLISSGSQGAIQFMDWLGLKVLPKGLKTSTNFEHSSSNNQQKDDLSTSQQTQLNREKWLPQPRSPLIIPKHLRNNRSKVKEIELKLQETYYKHHLDGFEEILGYHFHDRAYLVQAFTHNSYYENIVTDCYQRLEFLGDAVLDYLITRYLYEDSRCHSPGTLTDLRSALVNNTFFAALAVKYNFHKYLMMLSSELYRVIDGFVRKFNIYYNNSAKQTMNIDGINDYQNSGFSRSNNSTESNYNYWELFISENEAEHLEDIEVPKALGDIFESVAGAIYLDSGMSLEAVWKSYYPMMKPEIENFSDNVPKSPIRVLLEKQPQSVKFGKPEITSGRRIRVTVEVFGLGKFVGIGRNKRIAKCTAAKRALRALESEKRRKDLEIQRRLQEQLMNSVFDYH